MCMPLRRYMKFEVEKIWLQEEKNFLHPCYRVGIKYGIKEKAGKKYVTRGRIFFLNHVVFVEAPFLSKLVRWHSVHFESRVSFLK